MQIGPYKIANPVIAAPMAGVTDKPYRKVCRANGAGLVVSEMITSRSDLRDSAKTRFRSDLTGEPEPVVVQIVGYDPQMLAEAARYNVGIGAQIIDINMGCPAKKVCKKAAGSALLADEALVADILTTVVDSVDVPVTVKIRTGTDPDNRNAVTIARIAEEAGIQSLTIHGRTRACRFAGQVEYDTIAEVKQAIGIPVVANGDICTPEQAKAVLDYTKADAVMIGRAAQGQPWLFQQVADYLRDGVYGSPPDALTRARLILGHLADIHEFYGEFPGVRLARKHIKWYLTHWHAEVDATVQQTINACEDSRQQLSRMEELLFSTIFQKAA